MMNILFSTWIHKVFICLYYYWHSTLSTSKKHETFFFKNHVLLLIHLRNKNLPLIAFPPVFSISYPLITLVYTLKQQLLNIQQLLLCSFHQQQNETEEFTNNHPFLLLLIVQSINHSNYKQRHQNRSFWPTLLIT